MPDRGKVFWVARVIGGAVADWVFRRWFHRGLLGHGSGARQSRGPLGVLHSHGSGARQSRGYTNRKHGMLEGIADERIHRVNCKVLGNEHMTHEGPRSGPWGRVLRAWCSRGARNCGPGLAVTIGLVGVGSSMFAFVVVKLDHGDLTVEEKHENVLPLPVRVKRSEAVLLYEVFPLLMLQAGFR